MGSVDGLVAAGRPAGAAVDEAGVIAPTDQELAGTRLLLEVALEAQVLIPRPQHLLINGPMRVVAGDATFAGGFMFKHVGTDLLDVALDTGVVQRGETGPTLQDRLTGVRIVAVTAAHLAGEHGMRVGQGEFATFVQMALETGLG